MDVFGIDGWPRVDREVVGTCGDPVDLERLTWRHLRLHGSLPLFMLPRTKARQLGRALPRNTPLLPSTVDALKRWKAWRRREAADSRLRSDRHGHEYADSVFTNDKRRPYKSEKISHAFARLAKAVGKKASNWRLKHLRNVGPTLGKRHKRPSDERTTFLAHSESSTNRFYETVYVNGPWSNSLIYGSK